MRFKMFKEMGIENRFEGFSNSRSKGNRMIVGGIRAVTFLWSRMNSGGAKTNKPGQLFTL